MKAKLLLFLILSLWSASSFALIESLLPESVTDFFDFIADFLLVGIYEFLVRVVAYVVEALAYAFFIISTFLTSFFFAVALQILQDINLSGLIADAVAQLSPELSNLVQFFRVPEAVNNIAGAYVTRYIMSMMGV